MLLEEDVEREKIIRAQNEVMAKGCRDEMEILREALKIAVIDVAASLKGKHVYDNDGIGIDVVEYDNEVESNEDGIKAWVTHPVPQRVIVSDVIKDSSHK